MLPRLRHLVVWCLPSVWLPENSLQMKWTGCRIVWLSHRLWSALWSTRHKVCTVLWPFKKQLNDQCRKVQKGESTQWNITMLLLLTQGFWMVELQRANCSSKPTAECPCQHVVGRVSHLWAGSWCSVNKQSQSRCHHGEEVWGAPPSKILQPSQVVGKLLTGKTLHCGFVCSIRESIIQGWTNHLRGEIALSPPKWGNLLSWIQIFQRWWHELCSFSTSFTGLDAASLKFESHCFTLKYQKSLVSVQGID